MFLKTFDEGESFRCAGNNYVMLLRRDVTDCCEVVLEKVDPGCATPSNAHETFVQVYIILQGGAEVVIGEENRQISAPKVAFIPLRTNHCVTNRSPDQQLRYLYLSFWPKGIPQDEIEGGWKSDCQKMIQEYANRGFSNNEEAPAARQHNK